MADKKPRSETRNWEGDIPWDYDHLPIAILMDICDELKKLNKVFECARFLQIPQTLSFIAEDSRRIRLNTTKKRPKRAPRVPKVNTQFKEDQ